MHHAHPPRVRWHVETHDPLANEWSSGTPYTDPQTAVKARTYRDEHYPKWADGTPVERRLVLETTTFEDLSADVSHCAPFPKGGFVITGVGGQDYAALPDTTPDGRPAIRIVVGSSESGHADVVLPLDLLEQAIAGQREIARQSGPALPGAPITDEQRARAAAVLPPGARITAAALNAAERQFLTFALDLAADRMADRGDEFDDADEAALTRLRQLATEEAQPLTVHLEIADPAAIKDAIYAAVRRDPEE